MRKMNARLIQAPASITSNAPFVLVALVAFVAGCGPTLLFPGGALDGKEVPAPNDWGFAEEISTIQLETRPEDPYSVNIWAVGLGDQLYVHAGANRSTWVESMEVNPLVRAQVGERLFPLRASRVEGNEEFARFADAYEKKYGTRPRNENIAEIYLFRLSAR